MVVITHADDLDGVTCAVLAKKVYPDCETIMCSYGDLERVINKHLRRTGPLVIADLSLPQELAERLDRRGNVTLIDHHITSLPLAEKYPWAVVDISRCAALSLWHHLGGEERLPEYEELAVLANDRDLWIRQDPRSDDLAMLLQAMGRDRFFNRFVCNPSVTLDATEQLIVDIEKERIKRVCESAKVFTFHDAEGQRVGVVFVDSYVSDVANHILDTCKEYDYVVACSLTGNHPRVSLRSRKGGVDVSEMAKKLGGGGHPSAAGFTLPDSFVEDVAERIFISFVAKQTAAEVYGIHGNPELFLPWEIKLKL